MWAFAKSASILWNKSYAKSNAPSSPPLVTITLTLTCYPNQAFSFTQPKSSSKPVGPLSYSNPSLHCSTTRLISALHSPTAVTLAVTLSFLCHSLSLTQAFTTKLCTLKIPSLTTSVSVRLPLCLPTSPHMLGTCSPPAIKPVCFLIFTRWKFV